MSANLSVLVSARKNSKYLSKFVEGYRRRTSSDSAVELLILLNEHDTWNEDLVSNYERMQLQLEAEPFNIAPEEVPIRFYRENMQLGRAGLAEYFNYLVPYTRGDWIIYFCEDHFITAQGWDLIVKGYINGLLGSAANKPPLDSNEVWVIVPKFDNCGAMNHVLSRGFVRALGDKIGRHGWIDSYINDLMRDFPERVIRIDEELFHDFTHDKPSPMADSETQSVISVKGKAMPPYDSSTTRHRIAMDQELIKRALEKGGRP